MTFIKYNFSSCAWYKQLFKSEVLQKIDHNNKGCYQKTFFCQWTTFTYLFKCGHTKRIWNHCFMHWVSSWIMLQLWSRYHVQWVSKSSQFPLFLLKGDHIYKVCSKNIFYVYNVLFIQFFTEWCPSKFSNNGTTDNREN